MVQATSLCWTALEFNPGFTSYSLLIFCFGQDILNLVKLNLFYYLKNKENNTYVINF